MKLTSAVAWGVLLAVLAGCSSVSIGVGLPIGRMGSIMIGGTVPIPPAAPASAASAPSSAAPAASAP